MGKDGKEKKKKKKKGLFRAASRFLRGKKKGKKMEEQEAEAAEPAPVEPEEAPRLLYARDIYAFGADLATWTLLCVAKGPRPRAQRGLAPRETVLKREPVARLSAALSWSGTTSSACSRLRKVKFSHIRTPRKSWRRFSWRP